MASDKRPSRKRAEPSADNPPPLVAIMVDRLRTAFGAIDSGFLYRNEALDALAFTLTGLPPGSRRDSAFKEALAALEDIARPESEVAIAVIRGVA